MYDSYKSIISTTRIILKMFHVAPTESNWIDNGFKTEFDELIGKPSTDEPAMPVDQVDREQDDGVTEEMVASDVLNRIFDGPLRQDFIASIKKQ